MATKHLGTNATTSLTNAYKYVQGYGSGLTAAQVAAISQAILPDEATQGVGPPQDKISNRFTIDGVLYVPKERGWVKVLQGDVIAVDSLGWPVLVSAYAIANGPWTFNSGSHQLGTNANNSLTPSLAYQPGYNSGMSAADIATMSEAILDDSANIIPALRQSNRFTAEGVLYLPGNRGAIKLLPGDVVGVDSTGWPIVVSAYSIANGLWTFA